jgi:dihydrofolate reductase
VLRGDVVDEVTKLKAQYDRDIVVHGSPQLAQTLIEHDLVDALHLQVYPVIVGAGKRLFAETSSTRHCSSRSRRPSAMASTSSSTAGRDRRGAMSCDRRTAQEETRLKAEPGNDVLSRTSQHEEEAR